MDPIKLSSMLPTTNVANTTLESYAQTVTCTNCHQYSTIAPTLTVMYGQPLKNLARIYSAQLITYFVSSIASASCVICKG